MKKPFTLNYEEQSTKLLQLLSHQLWKMKSKFKFQQQNFINRQRLKTDFIILLVLIY